ncbi:MAG TPA: hypothetical protein VGA85_01935 [Dehalococcoidales bacterium]
MTINPSPPDKNEQSPNAQNNNTTWDKLLESPDILKAIAQIPDLIRENIQAKNNLAKTEIEAQASVVKGTTKWTSILIGILASLVIIGVCWLAYSDKISSDAVSVVLGTVIGSSFTFIMRAFRKE